MPTDHAKVWKEWRLENLLSQAEMATALGVSRRTVQFVEGGQHKPNPTTQERFKKLKKLYAANSEVKA